MERTKTIGLVGGVASGKSRVAQLLVDLGAGLLDADRTGHAVLADDPQVRNALRQRWGDDVIAADGRVDRAAVAHRVFGSGEEAAAERQFLEDLLHPRIRRRLEAEARAMAATGRPAVVLDAPLLLEAGWGPMCDVVLMVDASRKTRLARACARGWTESHFDQREAAQWPVVKKRGVADVVINNEGTEDELRDAVRQFWDRHVASR
ncbi:MAG: dephospho-CoA kinase [Planctomycetes bacterium]|nr:dephospho-CoA kinase [Planctomycetota bacterium]